MAASDHACALDLARRASRRRRLVAAAVSVVGMLALVGSASAAARALELARPWARGEVDLLGRPAPLMVVNVDQGIFGALHRVLRNHQRRARFEFFDGDGLAEGETRG